MSSLVAGVVRSSSRWVPRGPALRCAAVRGVFAGVLVATSVACGTSVPPRDAVDCDGRAAACPAGGDAGGDAGAHEDAPAVDSDPGFPTFDNVRVAVRGDNARIEFEPIAGARDYRIYRLPAGGDVERRDGGELVVRNAIYRCAGDRPVARREVDSRVSPLTLANDVRGYPRTEAESTLGHVYLAPGPGRRPVYRLSDPNIRNGYLAADFAVPPSAEYYGAEYVVGAEARDRLVARGLRDDGIAFYVPDDGTRPVYRRQYVRGDFRQVTAVFYTDGPERDARARENPATIADDGERFRIAATSAAGTVPLRRVFYGVGGEGHDVLAAGEARFQRAMYQGNLPLASLSWPGLSERTTLVIEALDVGCPFPGGYLASRHAQPDSTLSGDLPSITLEEARLPTGEVYVNGQFAPTNRPRAIARAYVDVAPAAREPMDWSETFDPGAAWEALPLVASERNYPTHIYRNARLSAEFRACTQNHTVGPVLGQLAIGGGEPGGVCYAHVAPRGAGARLAAEGYLHVRMASDVPSTLRRFPQIVITTVPVAEVGSVPEVTDLPVMQRLGPTPGNPSGTGTDSTIVVEPHGTSHELQVQFCDRRGWSANSECPRANLYGDNIGDFGEPWSLPWRAVPALDEVAGFDRLVQFDVYASTRRVYVFVDGRPGGCAVLPPGRMPAGPVTVLFGAVAHHIAVDEGVVPEGAPHEYLRRYSPMHSDRRLDDLGVSSGVAAPAWDEAVLPCGDRWYGGP